MAGATGARARQSGRVRQHGHSMASAWNRLLLALLAGFILRIALSPFGSFAQDANTMRAWAVRLATQPMSEFYSRGNLTDHLPGDLWFLWLIANVYELFSPEMRVREIGFLLLLKLVPAVADIGVGLMLFLLGRRLAGEGAGLRAALFFVFNPASIFLTSVWGQWDSVSAFFALTAVWLLVRGNVEWSFPVLAYAAVIKPPFAGLLPLFALVVAIRYILPHTRWGTGEHAAEPTARTARRAVIAVAASVGVLMAVLLPFGVGLPLMSTRWTIFERMRYALDVYPYTTLNAFTLWGVPIGGNWKRDTVPFLLGITYQAWGTVLLLAAVGYVLYVYWRRRSEDFLVWALVATTFALFMLPTRGHERYLFPAVVFASLLAALFPRLRWFLAVLSVVFLGNLYWVYDYYNPALGLEGTIGLSRVVFVGAMANLFLFVYLFVRAPALMHAKTNRAGTTANARRGNRRTAAGAQPVVPKPTAREERLGSRLTYLLPALVFLVALGLYLPRLGAAGRYYFDEVYFAYTAGQYVRGDAAAYIGRGEPPQRPEIATHRTYYEWTHPPLGKLLIAGGILAAGDRPVGWRLASTLFGAAGAALAYLIASTLSRSRATGVLAAGLLLLDGVYFAEARTGKVDMFVLVFTLAALLGLYRYLNSPPASIRRPLLWTGFMMGLGLATKWSAVYASALIGIVVLVRAYRLWRTRSGAEARAAVRQHAIWVPVALIALPLAVYALSYLPFLMAGHSVSDAIAQQGRMFRYHTNLVGSHPYKSRWWTWPLNLRPVLYYFERPGGLTTAIYASGNVMLYWSFLPAVAWLMTRWWNGNRRALVVLLIGFFGQWLPWMFSPRSSYIYHFLPAVPFGCFAVAVLAVHLWRRGGRWRVFVASYVTLTVLSFLYFYPIYSALPLTGPEFDARMWFRRWR